MKYYTLMNHTVNGSGAFIKHMIQNVSEHHLMMIQLKNNPYLLQYIIIEQERLWLNEEESNIAIETQMKLQDQCNQEMKRKKEEYRIKLTKEQTNGNSI